MVLNSKQKRPVSIQHKKRHGQHHKVTPHYRKTYWPYLPMLLVVALGISVNSLWSHADKSVLGYATDISNSELLADTNAQREANGLGPLNENSQLDNAAQAKANNMVALDYWSHDTPSGQPPWVFITNAGYNYAAAGENLAYGFDSSQDVITAWMGSPDHRANILDTSYVDVGFGFANSSNYQGSGPETVVVAEYAEPASAPAPVAPPASTNSAPPANTTPSGSNTAASNSTPTPPPATTTPAPTATTTPAKTTKVVASKPSPSNNGSTNNLTLQTRPVSRLELLSANSASWSMFAVTTITIGCVALVLLRHAIMWRRLLRKSELYAVRFHVFDIILVGLGVAGFLLTRSAGVIH